MAPKGPQRAPGAQYGQYGLPNGSKWLPEWPYWALWPPFSCYTVRMGAPPDPLDPGWLRVLKRLPGALWSPFEHLWALGVREGP